MRWDLRNKHIKYKELAVETWEDPAVGNDKNCLVDLTAKGGNPIDNAETDAPVLDPPPGAASRAERETSPPPPAGKAVAGPATETEAESGVARPGIGTRGLSGNPASPRSDQAALAQRLGRRETCFVNCAIQSASYPHRGGGPRVLNKPIVVDLDLPVWDDSNP